MFIIKGNNLYYKKKLLGPKTGLYVDSNELVGVEAKGVQHLHMPRRIDMVCTSMDKIIGIESKYPQDLVDSQAKKRLARQIRVLIEEVDVPCLLLRGLPRTESYLFQFHGFNTSYQQIWNDLVRLQALGITLLFGSGNHDELVEQLAKYGDFLTNKKAPLAAIAGSDKKKLKKGTPGWYLTSLKGLGPVTAKRLHEKFGSTKQALDASDEEWKEMKVPPKVIKRRQEAMT